MDRSLLIYKKLFRFLFPLAITSIVLEFGAPVLNAGMARMPHATTTLAAYGLAWALVVTLASPLGQARELGLVLADNRIALVRVRRFVLLFGLLLTGTVALLAISPMGHTVIEGWHGVSPDLAAQVRVALLLLIPYPLFKGLSLFQAGLLIRARRTTTVSYAMITGVGIGIAAVFILLPMPSMQARPILLPIVVTYITLAIELSILIWGAARYLGDLPVGDRTAPLGYRTIIRFYWPLVFIMLVQELSRPIINLFVARGSDGTEALAALTVAYAVGQITYRWINQVRNLPAAFQGEDNIRPYILRFSLACGLLALGMTIILFMTPLRDFILESLVGIEPDLARRVWAPLFIFSLFPLVVAVRAFMHGVGLVERRTRAMAPSAPARLLAVVLTLWIGYAAGVQGATLGIAALFAGFVAETFAVWLGVFRWPAFKARRRKTKSPSVY